MFYASEAFGQSSSGRGVSSTLPFNPLDLIALESATPKLVICYDWHNAGRIVTNVPRPNSICTHVFVTVLPAVGAPPVAASFSALCLTEVFDGGAFRLLRPELQHQASEIFGVLKELSPAARALHPNLVRCVEGCVVKEDMHIADSYMSADLHTDVQIRGALTVIEAWMADPPAYEVRSTKGANCHDFVAAVVKGAGLLPPWWWGRKPWPGMEARFIEMGGENLQTSRRWAFQPKAVTQMMYDGAPAAVPLSESRISFRPSELREGAAPLELVR